MPLSGRAMVRDGVLTHPCYVSRWFEEVYQHRRGCVETVHDTVAVVSGSCQDCIGKGINTVGVYQHSIGKCIDTVGGRVDTVSESVSTRSGGVLARYRKVYRHGRGACRHGIGMCINTVGNRVDTVSESVLIRSGVVSTRYREVY